MPIRPLLGRVEPYSGESLLSLLTRSATLNVIPRLRDIVSLAGIPTTMPQFVQFSKLDRYREIAQLLDIDPEFVKSLMHPVVHRAGLADAVLFQGTLLPRSFIDVRLRRYSARSLRQAAFARATWMLRPLSFCPDSMEMLLEECIVCGSKLRWLRVLGIHVCDNCGRSLRRAHSTRVEWSLQKDARTISNLVHVDTYKRAEASALLPQPFCHWEPGDAFAAVVEFGQVLKNMTNEDQEGHESPSQHIFSELEVSHLVGGYQILRTWPDSFPRLLNEIAKGRTGSCQTVLRPIWRLLSANSSPTPLRLLIREAAPPLFRSGTVPLKSRRGLRLSWISKGVLISAKQAERRFHIHRHIIRRLSKTGKCLVSNQGGWTQEAALYDSRLLAKSVAILEKAIRIPECARALGFPDYCVNAVVREGVLSSIDDEDALLLAGEPLFMRISLEGLIGQISDVPITAGPGEISLLEALQGTVNPYPWAAMLKAILDRRLRLLGRGSASLSVAERLLINSQAARKVLDTLQMPDLPTGLSISCLSAARALGISNVLLGKAAHAGFMGATKTTNRLMIPIADLDSFNTNYVFGGFAARLIGIPHRDFTCLMEAHGMKPIARISHKLLWLRREVRSAFPEFERGSTMSVYP